MYGKILRFLFYFSQFHVLVASGEWFWLCCILWCLPGWPLSFLEGMICYVLCERVRQNSGTFHEFFSEYKVLMILTAWCKAGYQVAADNHFAANLNERNPNSRRQWVLAFSGFCISIHLIWAALSVSHETFAKRQLDSLLNLVLPVSSYPTMVAAS